MFGLSDLKQTRVYQEGRQEGQQIGEAAVTLRILRRKLGSLSPGLEQQIGSLSVEQLEALAECLLELGSQDELQAWLDQQ